jgi:hypothetical protein
MVHHKGDPPLLALRCAHVSVYGPPSQSERVRRKSTKEKVHIRHGRRPHLIRPPALSRHRIAPGTSRTDVPTSGWLGARVHLPRFPFPRLRSSRLHTGAVKKHVGARHLGSSLAEPALIVGPFLYMLEIHGRPPMSCADLGCCPGTTSWGGGGVFRRSRGGRVSVPLLFGGPKLLGYPEHEGGNLEPRGLFGCVPS